MDLNLGTLLSTTLKKYRTTLVDNIFKSHAVWYMLKKKGAIEEVDGGERIVQPIMYGTNSTAKSYSGYEVLDVTPQSGIDAAEFNWKQYAAAITISGEEEAKNASSKTRIINLLDAKTKQARLSLEEKLIDGLFSDGTGNGGKNLTGFEAMILASGTYGGINGTANTFWQSYVDSTAEALSLADMRTAMNTPTLGGRDAPDLIVTTQTLYEKYESLLTTNYQTQTAGTKELGDAGFKVLEFKGTPIVWDEQVPSGTMYFINTDHLKLVVHKDRNFEVTPFVKPENQDARIAQILFMGNLTTDRRKSHSALRAKTG